MHPLAPSTPPPGFTSSYWTNDEIILSLDQINRGSPIPDDLIVDNPYQYDTSNLPDGAWFLVKTTEEKETKHGRWIAKGSACEIFANSAISGWRTTFEFSQVQAPIEQKTVWMMQEYKVTPKGQHGPTKSQDSALCRVFSCCSETKPEKNSDFDTKGELQVVCFSCLAYAFVCCYSPQKFFQVNNQTEGVGSSLVDKPRDHSDDIAADLDCILREDYLELDDLASHSSSSENSSRLSFASEEYFDYLALLRDLDDDAKKKDLNGNGSTDNYNIMMCVLANDAAVQLAPLESLVKGSEATAVKETPQAPDNNKTKSFSEQFPDHSAKRLKAERTDEGPSHSCRATTSSSSSSSGDEPGRVARREEKRAKKFTKYLCFMPF
ncbi:hypothetical protein CQW23_10918 [Capsicum baccatum]|uniref:NAC domain-containing protein n=1 Tax=Capsicum baccatum TaxID=33114 RepID=A0A2G2X155_CAPBA|nr:hypothetical protein CQW23_10918 [Capsicum baccatum]